MSLDNIVVQFNFITLYALWIDHSTYDTFVKIFIKYFYVGLCCVQPLSKAKFGYGFHILCAIVTIRGKRYFVKQLVCQGLAILYKN
jgi:hypothetical protein